MPTLIDMFLGYSITIHSAWCHVCDAEQALVSTDTSKEQLRVIAFLKRGMKRKTRDRDAAL